MKKILLCGFEPFGGETVNPSQELLNCGLQELDQTLLLPVSFERAFAKLQIELLAQEHTDIVMLGQAGGRVKVSLERVALNLVDSEAPDADGVVKKDQPINKNGPAAWMTNYPLRTWLDQALRENLPLEISNSAGTYVCNDLIYKVADWKSTTKKNFRWLFMHFPYLPSQLSGKSKATPTLDLEKMKVCTQFILDQILKA
jgi:pyroglutamyl-peptidase